MPLAPLGQAIRSLDAGGPTQPLELEDNDLISGAPESPPSDNVQTEQSATSCADPANEQDSDDEDCVLQASSAAARLHALDQELSEAREEAELEPPKDASSSTSAIPESGATADEATLPVKPNTQPQHCEDWLSHSFHWPKVSRHKDG